MPVFFKGIVFTNLVSKGRSLELFLKHAKFNPKKIIFIDDQIENLESVFKFSSENNILFIGIEYTAASKINIQTLNEKCADLQFQILEKDKKCISDNQALQFLNKK